MKKAVIYIHGKGGSAAEAEHYKPLFPDCDVIGFDYSAQTPWEAKEEFAAFADPLCKRYGSVTLIAFESVSAFAQNTNAALTVMDGGEHWFHTAEQMAFLDAWITGLR